MYDLSLRLFGGFRVCQPQGDGLAISAGKVQELFCYLLLNRQRLHTRDTILETLWGDQNDKRARKALRHTLWQLKTDLNTYQHVLIIEGDTVGVCDDIWLDVTQFERAAKAAEGVAGNDLSDHVARHLQEAVVLYQGRLLDGWYYDWCSRRADHLEMTYIRILDTLIDYCVAHEHDREAIMYAEYLLRCDPAHERTHRRLMCLFYRLGDRTTALRQYQVCARAMRDELDLAPSHQTESVMYQIRHDTLLGAETDVPPSRDVRLELQNIYTTLNALYRRIEEQLGHDTGQ